MTSPVAPQEEAAPAVDPVGADDALPARPQSYLAQAYARCFQLDVGGEPGNDLATLAHPNGIAVLALAPGHIALAGPHGEPHAAGEPSEEPASLTFTQGDGSSLLLAEMRKGRGPWVAAGQGVATLRHRGRAYALRCPARGQLIEAHAGLEALQGEELLRALADEYFAVVEIKGPELAKLQLASLSAEAYSEARRLPPGALR